MAIDLNEAVSILEGSDWVSLRFITADVQKGTGGQVIELLKCRIARNRQAIVAKAKDGKRISESPKGETKDPNHRYHFTRNVELANKRIVKVHPPLITHINNTPIL